MEFTKWPVRQRSRHHFRPQELHPQWPLVPFKTPGGTSVSAARRAATGSLGILVRSMVAWGVHCSDLWRPGVHEVEQFFGESTPISWNMVPTAANNCSIAANYIHSVHWNSSSKFFVGKTIINHPYLDHAGCLQDCRQLSTGKWKNNNHMLIYLDGLYNLFMGNLGVFFNHQNTGNKNQEILLAMWVKQS